MDIGLMALAAAIVIGAIVVSRRPRIGSGAGRQDESEILHLLTAQMTEQTANLSRLAGSFEESRRYEQDFAEAARHIERMVAGSFGKGRAGENILASVLSDLPPEMVASDFKVGGRTCEFALRMSDGKVMPIDSKWAAFDLIESMDRAEQGSEKEVIRKKIESEVCRRLNDVSGYIDTSLTIPLAIAAVPDAVYACCRKAHSVAKDLRIVIVSYSMAVPFVLSMWNLHRAYTRDVDSALLVEQIHQACVALGQVEDKIESHLSRSLTAAQNAVSQMRPLLAVAVASLRAAHMEKPEDPKAEEEEVFPAFRIEGRSPVG